MKRFYKNVATAPDGAGFAVLLDGKPVLTPGRQLMLAPTEALAQAIAGEWSAQGERVVPDAMPLTQLLTTTLDRAHQRDEIAANALAYLDGDLLCYRAPEADEQAAQAQVRDAWLEWFAARSGTRLEITTLLVKLEQPAQAHTYLRAQVAAMDAHQFTVFQVATALTGSAVLGLAMAEAAIDAETAWRVTLCEELHYEAVHDLERHGLDPIEDKRRSRLRHELDALTAYLTATRI